MGPGEGKGWEDYVQWAKIPGLVEVVSLDTMLCPPLITEFVDEDWSHNVAEDFRLNYFYHLDYLLGRVANHSRRNILGLYRNPETHIAEPPGPGPFVFTGCDLIEEQTQISALTNCGGFPKAFSNEELNCHGLDQDFDRAMEIKQALVREYPEEAHAKCEL